MTAHDFENAFEKALGDYPSDLKEHPVAYQDARWYLLNQLAEEGLLLERARELKMVVSDGELDQAVADIKADFPDDQFEQILVEQAVAFSVWKTQLARRILIDKVITRELGDGVRITPSVSPRVLPASPGSTSAAPPAKTAAAAAPPWDQRQTTETRYLDWVNRLQRNYPIEINWELWKKMTVRHEPSGPVSNHFLPKQMEYI